MKEFWLVCSLLGLQFSRPTERAILCRFGSLLANTIPWFLHKKQNKEIPRLTNCKGAKVGNVCLVLIIITLIIIIKEIVSFPFGNSKLGNIQNLLLVSPFGNRKSEAIRVQFRSCANLPHVSSQKSQIKSSSWKLDTKIFGKILLWQWSD